MIAHAASLRRVRFLACCRRLWQLEPGLALLWRNFNVEVCSEAAAQALLPWVHVRRARLESVWLQLIAEEAASSDDEDDSSDEEEVLETDGNQTLYVAALLGGAPVKELIVNLRAGEFMLGGWLVAAAPQLRALDVSCPGGITVQRSFSLLTGLTRLRLLGGGDDDFLEIKPGSLPPGLREVILRYPPPTLLEDSLAAAAAGLETCKLCLLDGDFSWAVLPRFAKLTFLHIRCADLDAAPAELAALIGLQALGICDASLQGTAALAPVAALTRLTRLGIKKVGVEGLVVPEGVLRLPLLKVRWRFMHYLGSVCHALA